MSYSMVNFGPLAAEIGLLVWSTPANFNGFRVGILHSVPEKKQSLCFLVITSANINRFSKFFHRQIPKKTD